MEFVRRVISILLVALWLPATTHCALEALTEHPGDLECLTVCSHGGGTSSEHLALDSCEIVESGAAKIDNLHAVAPPPSLLIFGCLCRLQAAAMDEAEALSPATYAAAHPDYWIPSRHLASRAVALARAPTTT